MCGICGFAGLEDKNLLGRMNRIMTHRGPDQHGSFSHSNIGIASSRLSIIDLKKGKQPIHNEDFSLWLVFNGEIYNYRELRELLIKRNHRFYTEGDTEVIVHSYEEWGKNCLDRFNGMFAFVIYDLKNKELFLARDRLGIKPLYYYFDDKRLIFASEIKSILEDDEIKREINPESFDSFFSLRYVPGENTMFKGIKKLLPAHYLVYKNKKLSIKRYWDLSFSNIDRTKEASYHVREFDRLMMNSLNFRLRSDVPIGLLLSGGIDSSMLLAYAKNANEDKVVRTFTLGFKDYKNNEFKYAKGISDYFDVENEQIILEPSAISLLPKTVWHMDEPLGDATAIPFYVITEKAKKHVKVLLSGEGTDEIFGGYEQYRITKIKNIYNNYFPSIARKTIVKALTLTLPKETFFNRLISYLSSVNKPLEEYRLLTSIFDEQEKRFLYSQNSEFHGKSELGNYFNNNYSALNKMLLNDINTFLPDDILLKLDKMCMANSIEGRVPFLDHNIVEFSASLPEELKINGMNEKFILKKALKRRIPARFTKRKKQRFFVPINEWFREENDRVKNYLLEGEIKKFFNRDFIQNLLEYNKKFKSQKYLLKFNNLTALYYSRQIWNLLVFKVWYETFIEKKKKVEL